MSPSIASPAPCISGECCDTKTNPCGRIYPYGSSVIIQEFRFIDSGGNFVVVPTQTVAMPNGAAGIYNYEFDITSGTVVQVAAAFTIGNRPLFNVQVDNAGDVISFESFQCLNQSLTSGSTLPPTSGVAINQAAHGFPLNTITPVYLDSADGLWKWASASSGNSNATHVAYPMDANNFLVHRETVVQVTGHGLGSPGEMLHVQESPNMPLTPTPGIITNNLLGEVLDANRVMIYGVRPISIGSASSSVVTQNSHGFVQFDVVRFDDTTNLWVKAQANSLANRAFAVVDQILDPNMFSLVRPGGLIDSNGGFPNGSTLYLSATVAGGLTTTSPGAIGTISQLIGQIQNDKFWAYIQSPNAN